MVDSGELKITIINYSTTVFALDQSGYEISRFLGGIIKSPGNKLLKGDGREIFDVNQILISVGTKPANIFMVWRKPDTGFRFGINIISPFQFLGMGNRPYWAYMRDVAPVAAPATWLPNGADPADPVAEDFDGFRLRATPQSWHTALDVECTIDDIRKGS